jgi:hypothetical protein
MTQPATEREDGGRRELTRRARIVGVIIWASFLAACAGTMFFFAFVAPDTLLSEYPAGDRVDRVGVYTLGFLGLWLLAALASALALYLHDEPGANHGGGRSPGRSP